MVGRLSWRKKPTPLNRDVMGLVTGVRLPASFVAQLRPWNRRFRSEGYSGHQCGALCAAR